MSLVVQPRGGPKKELVHHLRPGCLFRRSKHATTTGQGRGTIKDAMSIRGRPAEAEDRAVPGHGEADLLAGSGNTHIATMTERRSRFTILVKLDSEGTYTVVKARQRRVRTRPKQPRRTLTWDRVLRVRAASSRGRVGRINNLSAKWGKSRRSTLALSSAAYKLSSSRGA